MTREYTAMIPAITTGINDYYAPVSAFAVLVE